MSKLLNFIVNESVMLNISYLRLHFLKKTISFIWIFFQFLLFIDRLQLYATYLKY